MHVVQRKTGVLKLFADFVAFFIALQNKIQKRKNSGKYELQNFYKIIKIFIKNSYKIHT